MTSLVYTPTDLAKLASDIIMNGACTHNPVCAYVEFVAENDEGHTVIIRRMAGPRHAVIGMSTDPDSLLDIEKLGDLFYPDADGDADSGKADGDTGIEPDDAESD